MKKRNHNNRPVELPNFCHLGVSLRIALSVEAALIAGVIARVADIDAFWAGFVGLSALAQPALLLSLLALCGASRWLRSLPYIRGVVATLGIGGAILTESALSFLGIGVQEPAPTWGGMIRDGLPNLATAPTLTLSASFVLATTLIGTNLMSVVLSTLSAGLAQRWFQGLPRVHDGR